MQSLAEIVIQLVEGSVRRVSVGSAEFVVLIDPSADQIAKMMVKYKDLDLLGDGEKDAVRFFVDFKEKKVYVWPAWEAIHREVTRVLGIPVSQTYGGYMDVGGSEPYDLDRLPPGGNTKIMGDFSWVDKVITGFSKAAKEELAPFLEG